MTEQSKQTLTPDPLPPDQPDPASERLKPAGQSRERRSWFAWARPGLRGLRAMVADWAGQGAIADGAGMIRFLWRKLRAGPVPNFRFKTKTDGSFDLMATSFLYGMTVAEYEALLRRQQWQTAFAAYLAWGLTVLFVIGWLLGAMDLPSAYGRFVRLMETLPFCLVLFLTGFYQALLNYQIRCRRLVGWREYLFAEKGFWPCF